MVRSLLISSPMELRRQNDIIAFKSQGEMPVAFHARNLEVAEISEELWTEMGAPSNADSELKDVLKAWSEEINPEVKSGKLEFGIRSLTINVTQICNLKCTYCAAGGDGTYGQAQTKISVEKTLPQLKFFLEKLNSGDSFRITFLGGEPLLYPEGIRAISNYVTLMTAGRNIHASFSIVTNGTLFTDENIALLREINCKITVSIDGPAPINDSVRPMKNGQGSTHVVEEGLKKLFAVKSELKVVNFHGVFHATNTSLVDAYEFYQTYPADAYDFTYGVSENDPEANTRFIKQMNLVAAKAYTRGGEAALRKIGFFDAIFAQLDEQRQKENHCGAGKSYLMVDAKNNLYTCPWDVGAKSELVGQGEQLNYEQLEPYQQSLIEKNNCQTCWARYLCGGGCMFVHKQATGHKNRKGTQFCERTRSLIATSIMYYKKSREIC